MPTHSHTDEQLWLHTTQGDEQAFAILVGRYKNLIYSLAYTSLGNEQDSEEVVMDVFTSLWRSSSRIQLKFTLKTYLVECARNRILLYQKRQAKRLRMEVTGASDLEQIPEIENSDFLESVLALLPKERSRKDLELLMEGTSYKEISTSSGRNIWQVYKSVERSIQFLRIKFKR